MENRFAGVRSGMRDALFVAAVVLGPALLLWHLHGQWDPNGEYAYGWAVPMLAVFIGKSRWDDRPLPSTPLRGMVFLALFFALIMLPARWLQEAAPERSICAWTYGIASVGGALSIISLAGGSAWLRWFSFPFIFVLTAIPWPHSLEKPITNSLMHGTAGVTVEILCLIGIPSTQSGNLVQIENGTIDIAEACSGIRSLQAMVMISLFIGELFRLKPARRLLLLVIGLSVTLLANVMRTVTLSGIGFKQGLSAVDRYHDFAGFAVLAASLLITLFAAFLLRPSRVTPPPLESSGSPFPLPLKLGAALLVWFLLGEVSVEAWYRLHESKWEGWSWAVRWPQHRESFHFIEIPKNSIRLLRCDESYAGNWREPDGSDWSIYWIRWNPGNKAAEEAKVHRPDVCLTSEGAILEKDTGIYLSSLGRTQIPFHSYTFRLGGKTLYVFFCLYEERPGDAATATIPEFEGVGMFQRAMKGRRQVGQQTLEVVLSGYPSEVIAREAFKARMGHLITARRD